MAYTGYVPLLYTVNDWTNQNNFIERLTSTYIATQPTDVPNLATVSALVTGGLSFQGGLDASLSLFPATRTGGAPIEAGDFWSVTVAGTLGGTNVIVGDTVLALIATPGQTPSNWLIDSDAVKSVFTRIGNVTAEIGDYDISQITDGLSNVLADGDIFVGNGSNVATAVTMSGDATIDNAGAVTLNTVPITKGGTGEITANAALNALLPNQTGNVGKILGTNGTNATWVIESTIYDATVGVGGNYATVSLALLDNKKSIVIVGNTTETSNVIITQNTSITALLGTLWDLGDFQIQLNANNITINIESNGVIKWSPTTSKAFIDGLATTDNVLFRYSMQIDGSDGTANDCPLYANIQSVNGWGITIIIVPNQNGWGIHQDSAFVAQELGVITFLGFSPSVNNLYNLVSLTTGLKKEINSIFFVGNFDTVNPLVSYIGDIKNISFIDFSAGATLKLDIGGSLVGCSFPQNVGSFDIKIISDEASIANCDIGTGDIDINGKLNVNIVNVVCNDVLNQ